MRQRLVAGFEDRKVGPTLARTAAVGRGARRTGGVGRHVQLLVAVLGLTAAASLAAARVFAATRASTSPT